MSQSIYTSNAITVIMNLCGHSDRDLKVFHVSQKSKVWHAFIVPDIEEKVENTKQFKMGLDELLKGMKDSFAGEHKKTFFLRGPYDEKTLSTIRQYISKHVPLGAYKELTGDYFKFMSRYYLLQLIDGQQLAEASK